MILYKMFRHHPLSLPLPPVSDIPGVHRRRGSGPESTGPGRLPGLSVLLLQEHRRGLQKARGLLRHLGRRGDGPHPLVSLRIPESQSGFFLLNPAPILKKKKKNSMSGSFGKCF